MKTNPPTSALAGDDTAAAEASKLTGGKSPLPPAILRQLVPCSFNSEINTMNIQTIAESHRLLDQHAGEQEKRSPVIAALLVFNPALVTWMAKQTMSEAAFAEYLAAANIPPQIADAECLTIEQHLLNLKEKA